MDHLNVFFAWLAVQPPFVEVGLGACFGLIVAPGLVGALAVAVTTLEEYVEKRSLGLQAILRAEGGANRFFRLPDKFSRALDRVRAGRTA